MRPAGFEPATNGFEAHYSIQLSYGRVDVILPNALRRVNPRSYVIVFATTIPTPTAARTTAPKK